VAKTVGSITLDVILRTQGEHPVEHVAGTITVPVKYVSDDEPAAVDPLDIEAGLGALGTPQTRKARRKARR
jgi:hypothetical protein